MLASSLACFFVYTLGEICGRSFFRTRNRTLHSPLCVFVLAAKCGRNLWSLLHSLVICVRRLSVFTRKFVAALARTSNIHTLHSLVICARRLSVFMRKFVAALVLERVISRFRTSNIHTLHSLVICVRRLSVLGFCYVCGRLFFRTSNIHTPFRLFICDGSSRAVSDRRGPRQLGDPSRIVTIRQLFQG